MNSKNESILKKLTGNTLFQFSLISFIVILLLSIYMAVTITNIYNNDINTFNTILSSKSLLTNLPSSLNSIYMVITVFCIFLYTFLFIIFQYSHKKMNTINYHLDKTKEVTLYALATLAETRDVETGRHLERTSQYVSIIANELKQLPQYKKYLTDNYIDDLVKSAPLHDIGKVGIRDSILLKPGGLTFDEFEQMKTHCEIGSETLRMASEKLDFRSFLTIAIQLSKFHHEKWDGQGYPDGLKEVEIPLSARIMALADVYDALRSTRPYKESMSHNKAKEIIISESGKHFDPEIVNAFIKNEMKFCEISRDVV